VLVNQSFAHAFLAKVPVIHGPYSCLIPPVAYFLFGTCMHGSMATGSLVALLTGEAVKDIPTAEERGETAALLSVMTGVVLLVMGLCHLGFLVRFFSRVSLSGFITGSAFVTGLSQMKNLTGGPVPTMRTWRSFDWGVLIDGHRAMTVFTSVFMLVCLVWLKRAKRRPGVPRVIKLVAQVKELVVVVYGLVLVLLLPEQYQIPYLGAVPSGIPEFRVPPGLLQQETWIRLLPTAASIAACTFISSFATSKGYAVKCGYTMSTTSEFVALGFANFGGGFLGAFPTQIALCRTAIGFEAGIHSPLGSNLLPMVVVALVVQFATRAFYYVPRCALACIIVIGCSGSCDWHTLAVLYRTPKSWRQRRSVGLWLISCLGTVFLGVFSGLLLATGISLVMLIRDAAQPRMYELGKLPRFYDDDPYASESWVPRQLYSAATPEPGVIVVRLEGDLNFANSERFTDTVERLVCQNPNTTGVVFDACCCPTMDMTAVLQVEDLVRGLRSSGVRFVFANVLERPRDRLEKILHPEQPSLTISVDAAVTFALTGTTPSPLQAVPEQEALTPSLRRRRPTSLGHRHAARLPVQEGETIWGGSSPSIHSGTPLDGTPGGRAEGDRRYRSASGGDNSPVSLRGGVSRDKGEVVVTA